MKQFSAIAALFLVVAWTQVLLAQTGAAPDVVMTLEGNFYRGTISEKTAEEVEIVLVSGKIRTLPMDEVTYAGPAKDAPGLEAEADDRDDSQRQEATARDADTEPKKEDTHRHIVTVRGKEARLRLEARPSGVTFHRRAASASAVTVGPGGAAIARSTGYEEMCTAPCEVTMPAGTHTLALSTPDGSPVEAKAVTIPAGDSTLRGRYESRSGVRAAGTVILIAGAVFGAALMVTSLHSDDASTSSPYLGGGVMLGGLLIGMPMMYVSDRAEVQVAGNAMPPSPVSRGVSFAGAF